MLLARGLPPTKIVSGLDAVAVGTPDNTLLDLVPQNLRVHLIGDPLSDSKLLHPRDVIEVENSDIGRPAIDARVLGQVL